MGKRKSSKKPQPKASKLKPLDKTFRCLFCQHGGKVFCKMDKSEMIGYLECTNCSQKFNSPINHLSEPIDVYSDWIDASDAANRGGRGGGRIEEDDEDEDLAKAERLPAPANEQREVDDFDAEGEYEEERRPPARHTLNADDFDDDNLPDF